MTDIQLAKLLKSISAADEEELNTIIRAVSKRFTEIWPAWELLIISVHGHDVMSHLEALQKSIAFLEARK